MTERMKYIDHSESADRLARAGIDMVPVSADRRIVVPHPSIHGVEEFFSRQLNRRMIAAPAEGIDAIRHRELKALGLPVLPDSDVSVDGLQLWEVPPGSYPLHSVLHTIAQNVPRYGTVLAQARDLAHSLRGWQTGASAHDEADSERTMLDHFVVTQTPDGAGAALVLAPPYRMSADPADDPVEGFKADLHNLNMFSPDHLAYVFQEN